MAREQVIVQIETVSGSKYYMKLKKGKSMGATTAETGKLPKAAKDVGNDTSYVYDVEGTFPAGVDSEPKPVKSFEDLKEGWQLLIRQIPTGKLLATSPIKNITYVKL